MPKPLTHVPVRFFAYEYDTDESSDTEGLGDIVECDEDAFISKLGTGTLSYERHTVHANGISQICLTIL